MVDDFPDDANGFVLRQMKENGDDLTKPRTIDFSVVFPTQVLAEAFAHHIKQLGHTVSIRRSEVVPDLPWDVTIKNVMVPTHARISEFEDILADHAEPFGGRNDGWGCQSRPVRH